MGQAAFISVLPEMPGRPIYKKEIPGRSPFLGRSGQEGVGISYLHIAVANLPDIQLKGGKTHFAS